MNVLPRALQLSVLHHLVEGNSLRSITRLTKVNRTTIMKLMVQAGDHLRKFLDARMRGLVLKHVQCDELWTFVQKKEGHKRDDGQSNDTIGDMFLFVAIDQLTKLVPSWTLGKRNGPVTERFMKDLSTRIVTSQMNKPQERVIISTDGWRSYPSAVENAFGAAVRHGILIKDYANAEQPGRYGPPELVGEQRIPMSRHLNPQMICTSHVERHNLTIRTFMRRFTRLALGFSKKLTNLEACTSLYIAHYNFCRRHRTLRKTPAMAAGLAGSIWTLERLLSEAGMFRQLAA